MSVRIAIADADAETARVIQRGNCVCCRPSRPVDLIATDTEPKGHWLDLEGQTHVGVPSVIVRKRRRGKGAPA